MNREVALHIACSLLTELARVGNDEAGACEEVLARMANTMTRQRVRREERRKIRTGRSGLVFHNGISTGKETP